MYGLRLTKRARYRIFGCEHKKKLAQLAKILSRALHIHNIYYIRYTYGYICARIWTLYARKHSAHVCARRKINEKNWKFIFVFFPPDFLPPTQILCDRAPMRNRFLCVCLCRNSGLYGWKLYKYDWIEFGLISSQRKNEKQKMCVCVPYNVLNQNLGHLLFPFD